MMCIVLFVIEYDLIISYQFSAGFRSTLVHTMDSIVRSPGRVKSMKKWLSYIFQK